MLNTAPCSVCEIMAEDMAAEFSYGWSGARGTSCCEVLYEERYKGKLCLCVLYTLNRGPGCVSTRLKCLNFVSVWFGVLS